VALHVLFSSPPLEASTTGGDHADRARADRYLAESLAGWAWPYPDVVVERLFAQENDLVYTLRRAAQRSRLLVAGMGRTGRFAELVYGSLTIAAMRGAACPVLLVPPGWRPRSTREMAGAAAKLVRNRT
jgi:hypothetical protein